MEGMKRKAAVNGRVLHVYLPPSYSGSGRSYPVVYLHDGGEAAFDGINYLEYLFHEGRLPELIFVGIEPRNRMDEYTPWPSSPLVPGKPEFGGAGDRYLEEVALRIKPFIDRECRTLPDREHTGLAGCSLGGLISLRAYYRYSDIFGKIALISASLWYEGIPDYVRREPVPKEETRLFLSVGALEGRYKRNVQRDMADRTRLVHSALLERGVPGDRLKLEIAAEGTHDPMFFARKFTDALQWLFAGEADGYAR